MFLLAVFLLPLLLQASNAITACSKCGEKSGAMCYDSKTFTLCDHGQPLPGRHSCPIGMICADDANICIPAEKIAAGTAICEDKCGKCGGENRFACVSPTSFSLCFGNAQPSTIVHRCPTNKVCSTTRDPTSREFCFEPVTLREEDITCYSQPASAVFGRFIAAAPQSTAAPQPAAATLEAQ